MLKPIAIATAVAGTLDILFAMILTVVFGREIGNMLRYVALRPLPAGDRHGQRAARSSASLVHFALMAIMAAVYVLARRAAGRTSSKSRSSGASSTASSPMSS